MYVRISRGRGEALVFKKTRSLPDDSNVHVLDSEIPHGSKGGLPGHWALSWLQSFILLNKQLSAPGHN